MCGIAAVFNYRTGQPVDRAEMGRVLAQMQRRGPDGSGEWYGLRGTVGLGHRRLSIIDLSDAGAQPMVSADGRVVVTFNGEIYNYRELRAELESKGRRFHSHSDTEVLLHLYQLEGQAMLRKLRGMYAFVIWDEDNQSLFLARDPYGIKPMYYSDDGHTFRAASQAKALLAGGHIDTSPEPAGHVGYFLWGYVPAPFTLYKGIRTLPAGSSIWVDRSGLKEITQFCSIPAILAEAEQTGPQSSPLNCQHAEVLRSALADTVRHHLIADVPVGVFLSSGLDSGTITALAAESSACLRTVTLGFEEFRGTPNDEAPLAEQIAAQYGARHQTIWVSKQDFRDNFSRLIQAMDQPSCDGVNSFFISHAAAKAGLKVALSGLGGDELFGGYPSFSEIPRALRILQPFGLPALQPFNRYFRILSAPVLKRLTSPKYAGLFEYGGTCGGAFLLRRGLFMPWELPEVLDPDLVRDGWAQLAIMSRLEETTHGIRSSYLRVAAMEAIWYMQGQLLRDTDWASMHHSLEVRTPLVDVELLRKLAPLLASDSPPTKQQMAQAPRSPLPTSVLSRPKTGFTVPVRQWLVQEDSNFQFDRGLRGWTKLVYGAFLGDHLDLLPRARAAAGPGFKTASHKQLARARATATASRLAGGTGGYRILALVPDGFGGRGGIAKFNRDLLTALCSSPEVGQVTSFARIMPDPAENLPAKLEWRTNGLGGKLSYSRAVIREALRSRHSCNRPWVIVCGHINLLPIAMLARRLISLHGPSSHGRVKPPVVLFIHGIDAWQPTRSRLSNLLAEKVQAVVAVSELTRSRFTQWRDLPPSRTHILPNSVDLSAFQPGPKPEALLERYRLRGRTILLTVGRLRSHERQKGFDEVLEILPALAREIPTLSYMIMGDGDDRLRLVTKARSLGLAVLDVGGPREAGSRRQKPANGQGTESGGPEMGGSKRTTQLPINSAQPQVVFTGYVAEAEKADHYRVADLYVMPSRGEGFGIVYLEALACGLPAIGSKLDGSREALRNGLLGTLVDPANAEELKAAIRLGLRNPSRSVPPGLSYFSYADFERRCNDLLRQITRDPGGQPESRRSA